MQVLITEQYLDDIADAIREKNGTETTYKPPQMAAAIEALPDPSVLDSKSITANGTYDPSDDDLDGYDEVTVNVPNSYVAADEGKVVSSGALVTQTSRNVTENGTYDTTTNDEVVVNVSSGGGSSVKLMEQGQVSTTSTYSTASFDSSVDFSSYDCLKVDIWRDGEIVASVVHGDATYDYSTNSTFYMVGGGYTYTMQLNTLAKTISCSRYSGNYANLYVDVYGVNL